MYLFSRKGFPRTTVRDIATQAGITDAAIYYHFATKDELLQEILQSRLQPERRSARRTLPADIRQLVLEAAQAATRVIEENHELLRIILREGLAGDSAAALRWGQLLDDWESRLYARLHSRELTGALASGEASLVARQIMSTIIMALEDMLLLRPDPSIHPPQRRLQVQVFLSRRIERLLSPLCHSAAEVTVAGDGDR
jgi:AcrR family transcriptional regulator